jgi:hypothetical protein
VDRRLDRPAELSCLGDPEYPLSGAEAAAAGGPCLGLAQLRNPHATAMACAPWHEDTSNPFVARFIPTPDESMLVIRFANPRGIDFPYLLSMLHGSFMSRANTIVCPGGKMDLAMQLVFTPMIWRLIERRKQALGG